MSIITISRGTFSGGKEIAEKLADAICTITSGVDGGKEVVNNINVGSKWLL